MDRRASAAVGGRTRTGRQYRNRGSVCHEHNEPDALEYATAVCQRWGWLRAVRGGSADNTSQCSTNCPGECCDECSAKWLSSSSTIGSPHQDDHAASWSPKTLEMPPAELATCYSACGRVEVQVLLSKGSCQSIRLEENSHLHNSK